MIKLSTDFLKLLGKLDRITAAAKKNTRAAAQAGAQVYQDEAQNRAPVSAKPHSTKGKKQTYQPGNFRNAIYQAHMKEESGDGVDKYRVGWNKKKAFYGKFLERGTSKMAARPTIRPTYDAVKDQAEATALRTLQQGIAREME